MSRPRISRICSSSRSSNERPSNTIRPFGIFAVRRGNSRMIESAVTDLPEPDSPTMATTSPRFTVKLTPSTARTMPRVVVNWVWRSSTANSGAAASGRVFDRPRKFSPASTILKTRPPLRRHAAPAIPPVYNAGTRGNAQAPVRDFTNAALRSVRGARQHARAECKFLRQETGNYAGAMPQWRLCLRWVRHRVIWVSGNKIMRRSNSAKCPAFRRSTRENIFDNCHCDSGGRSAVSPF